MVGLSTILLAVVTAFMVRMRADAAETSAVVAVAQCRVMLHAGLNYIQESSLLGWLPDRISVVASGAAQSRAALEANNDAIQSFGWTDVRDGTLGPKGPRNTASPVVTEIPAIPWPTWASAMTWRFPADPAGMKRKRLLSPVDGDLPREKDRVWPCPGAAVRCPMARAERPPFATRLTAAYNPLRGWNAPGEPPSYEATDQVWARASNSVPEFLTPGWWLDELLKAPAPGLPSVGVGALDPQPVDPPSKDPVSGVPIPDDWATFAKGGTVSGSGGVGYDWINHRPLRFDSATGTPQEWTTERLAVVPGTENQTWFRIYRETLDDHDNDGDPYYDRVAINESSSRIAMMDPASLTTTRNWNIFVIACGSGPTRGYRFWDLADDDPRRALEPVTAKESGLWGTNQALFEQQLAETTILWFRVEWSANDSGSLDTGTLYNLPNMRPQRDWTKDFYKPWYYTLHQNLAFYGWANYWYPDNINVFLKKNGESTWFGGAPYFQIKARDLVRSTQGGSFRFVQRLDREPPRW